MTEPAAASSVRDLLVTSQATVAVIVDDPRAGDRVEALLSSDDSLRRVRVEAPLRMVERCGGEPPQVVVLCCAPDRASEAIEMISDEVPPPPIVLVLPARSTTRLFSVPNEHVRALVYLDCLEALAPAVRAVLGEQVVVPSSWRRDSNFASLSLPERDVLQLATQGSSNEQIATHLSLETGAVKAHLSSAFAKLAARPKRTSQGK